jgi:hypothetical protein
MLLDTNGRRFYVGEAADLVKRLLQPHGSIPDWNFFRYNVLPAELASYRVALERMLIRDFAAVLKNKRQVPAQQIADCELTIKKINMLLILLSLHKYSCPHSKSAKSSTDATVHHFQYSKSKRFSVRVERSEP